jgi:hypothetical protein
MKRYLVAPLAIGLTTLGLSASSVQPPDSLTPKNLELLNTEKDEDDPFPASDGLHMYYSSNAGGKTDIMVSVRKGRMQLWPAGSPLGGYIQTKTDDRSVFLTPEAHFPQYLYFATRKDMEKDANFDIYVAVRQHRRADFTAPTPLNSVCSPYDELHPWLTADGRQLYFSRKTQAGWRVFAAARQKTTGAAGFGEPKLVDLPVGFHHATLTPNGQTMYLQGPLEKKRWGLFRATRTPNGWSKPEPLAALNHPDAPTGDRSPALSSDGSLLYFASDRPGGKGGLDLWAVPTAELNKIGKAERRP